MTSAFDTQVNGSHYKSFKIQPLEFFYQNRIPKPEGDVIQYLLRWRAKNGVEDLKKARHTLDMLIELAEKEEAVKQPTNEELLLAGHSPKEWRVSDGDSPLG